LNEKNIDEAAITEIDIEQTIMENLLTILEQLPEGHHTIAIDGRCAAGKTTFAERLSKHIRAGVVHMDDFFLPMELRTPERLAQPGGNVHYERFQEEVLPFLKESGAFSYQKFDCSIMAPGETRLIPASRFTIVEGAYSCHPVLGQYMSLRIFLDVDPAVQLERIRMRNGEEKLKAFREKWIPMEEAYFKEFQIEELADIVVR